MSEPFDSMTMSDAAVTIRSLPRRCAETIGGPVGDDSWDRTVRSIGGSGRSALANIGRADAELVALGTVLASLPMEKTPSVNLGPIDRKNYEPSATTEVGEVLALLKENAGRAARALEGRRPEDFDRSIMVDGKPMTAANYVRRAVSSSLLFLKHAQTEIDAALDAH